MKNIKIRFIFAGFLLCAAAGPVLSQEKSGEEIKLEACAGELNKEYSEGQQRVADKIKAQFGVGEDILLELRFRKMSNGEIAIALGLAQSLRRGITDKNLNEVVTLREGPPVAGWGKVAKKLGIKLGPVISKLQKISAEVRRQEKTDIAEKAGQKEAAAAEKAKAGKAEKSGNSGKPETTGKAGMKSLSRE